jgi:hypothetical protein
MENFLSNFANTNAEVTSSNAVLSVSPEFFGSIDVHKGSLKMTISFYARMYASKYRNYIRLDDWDINSTTDISFADMPIDSLSALKTMLSSSGLTTVANGLEVSNDDYRKEIATQIGQSKQFIDLFGKRAKMFDALSETQKKKVWLEYAIENYEKLSVNSEEIKDLVIIEEGIKLIPTLEQIKEVYNNLKIN